VDYFLFKYSMIKQLALLIFVPYRSFFRTVKHCFPIAYDEFVTHRGRMSGKPGTRKCGYPRVKRENSGGDAELPALASHLHWG